MKKLFFLTVLLCIFGVPNVFAETISTKMGYVEAVYEAKELEELKKSVLEDERKRNNPIEIELDKEYTGIAINSYDHHYYKVTINQPVTIVQSLANKEGVNRDLEICNKSGYCEYFRAYGDMDWLKKRNQPLFKETQYAKDLVPGTYTIKISSLGENDEYSFRLSTQKFEDVDIWFWAYNEIDYIFNKGIIKGFDGKFKPSASITRAEAAVMFARALNLDLSNVSKLKFSDVATNHWAYKEIVSVINAGIFPQETSFKPNQPLTRGEMAEFLVKAYNLTGNYNGVIKDVKDEQTLNYVKILAANQITNINSDYTFKPNNSVTRAEFAAFFARILNDKFKNYNRDLGIRPA